MQIKSISDIRTLRGINAHRGPMTEEVALKKLYNLAKERHRLEKEGKFWERKSLQIRNRLEEIGRQMESLKKTAISMAKSSNNKKEQPSSLKSKKWKEMTLNY